MIINQTDHAASQHDPGVPPAVQDLARLSARIGTNRLLVQGAGGNTSVKLGAAMWIKASGTHLADALNKPVFIPVEHEAVRRALAIEPTRADNPSQFIIGEGHGQRPSIETALHAVLPHKVVLHVHCVNTLAYAIRADAKTALAKRLKDFKWLFTPYIRPGARLAHHISTQRQEQTDVIVLGNHGLIVAGQDINTAATLLDRVTAALSPHSLPAPVRPDRRVLLEAAASGDQLPPDEDPLHQLAFCDFRCAAATGGSLFPDYVVFCGVGAALAHAGQSAEAACNAALIEGAPPPSFVLFPGKGALLRAGISAAQKAQAHCLAEVLIRLPERTPLNHLTVEEIGELLNWDAEKYRHQMNAL